MLIQPLEKNSSLDDIFNKINELVDKVNDVERLLSKGLELRKLSDFAKEQPPRGE